MSAAAPSPAPAAAAAPATPAAAPQRVIIVPGNGCGRIEKANWYCWVARELAALGFDARCKSMPDPDDAKESVWIPFIRDELGADADSILIGHSSGAEAGLRFAESHKLRGLILVSACHTDLGLESEAISGYYNRPWNWDQIRANTEWRVQFHSTDDPFIPIEEARHVAENIKSEYIEHTNRNHYMHRHMQDVIDIVVAKCGPQKKKST